MPDPIFRFSIYTGGQILTLERVADKLLVLSKGWPSEDVDTSAVHNFTEYYDLFWLWTLGAFEVVRTMHQHRKSCFGPDLHEPMEDVLSELTLLRVPFAKQERPGKKKWPIFAELSVKGINGGLVFEVEDKEFNSNETIARVSGFFDSIKASHILKEIPTRRE